MTRKGSICCKTNQPTKHQPIGMVVLVVIPSVDQRQLFKDSSYLVGRMKIYLKKHTHKKKVRQGVLVVLWLKRWTAES